MSRTTTLAVLRPPEVKEGDAAPLGQVTSPIASDAWATHPEYGLTPARLVAIFRLAEDGFTAEQCDLFTGLLERNATARQLFDGRRAAVAGKEWSVTPDGAEGDSELAAAVLDDALRDLTMGELFDHQLTFNAYGWGAAELDWGLRTFAGRTWVVPVGFVAVPHRRFKIDPKTDELRLLTAAQPTMGEALQPGKWWVTTAAGPQLARAGLMRPASWLCTWVAYALRDWLVKSERFGVPLALAKYDPQSDDAGRKVAAEIVRKLGSDGGAAIPREIEIELKELAAGGDVAGIHGGLISYSERSLAKLIVGGTLSSDNAQPGAGGSYAQAEVHALGRFELVEGDARALQRTFGRAVALPFLRFNGLAGRPPVLRIQVAYDQTPDGQLKAADTMQNKLGIKVSVSQLRQITGLRQPIGPADEAPGPSASDPASSGASP